MPPLMEKKKPFFFPTDTNNNAPLLPLSSSPALL